MNRRLLIGRILAFLVLAFDVAGIALIVRHVAFSG